MDAERRFLFSHLRLKAVVWTLPVGVGLVSSSEWATGQRTGLLWGESVNAAGFKEVQDVFTYL